MKKASMTKAASALANFAQKRTFVGPNIAVTGYPLQIQQTTFSVGNRSYFAWDAIVQPMNQESEAKYGAIGARVNPAKAYDADIDKADKVVYNTYPEGSVVARNDRFGKETEEMMIAYPYTQKKYKALLKPRAADEYERRVKFYGMLAVSRGMSLFIAKSVIVTFVTTLGPMADMKALASCEVDIGFLEPGQVTTIMWQGKPVFIHRRTPKQIDEVKETAMSDLRDPETDEERFPNRPEYAVMIAICTHLGCIPVSGGGDYGAYLCPCHGSHYDYAGRIRKGPAPLNLEVPPYYFIDDSTLLIGKSSA